MRRALLLAVAVVTALLLVAIVLASHQHGVAAGWAVAFWLVVDAVLVTVWLVRYRRA